MYLINPKNEYPRFRGDLRLEHPDWTNGDPLPEGWVEALDVEAPITGKYEVLEEEFPVQVDGVYYRNLVVRPMTAEERERVDAPETAKAKLLALGLTEAEVYALGRMIS